jgi:formylmethanofuran dehydrogenase subunit E
MFYSDNPIADFDRWDAEQNKQLENLPVCADCDNPIQDDSAYYINGEWICEDCMDSYKRVVLPE